MIECSIEELRVPIADPDAISACQRTAQREGWGLSVIPAQVTEHDGLSAGVAVAARSVYGMSSRDLNHIPVPFRHRIACVHCGVMRNGGAHFRSVYFWCFEGLLKCNLDLMPNIAQLVLGSCY